MRKYRLKESIFEEIDSEEKAYWLGFLLADGSIYKRMYTKKDGTQSVRQSTIKLCLQHRDVDHVQKFLDFLESNQPVKTYHNDKYSSSEVIVSSKKIVEDLEKLGITERKSHICELPIVSKHLKRHLIRGIWDGDGSVLYRVTRPKYPTCFRPEIQLCGNYKVVSEIQNILAEETECYKTSICPVRSIFLFRYVGQNAKKIVEYLYKDSLVSLDRKMEVIQHINSWEPKRVYPANRPKRLVG